MPLGFLRPGAASLQDDPILKIPPEPGTKCKHCEYRIPGGSGESNGFRECWGALADATPHVLDLYRIDLVGGRGRDIPAELAARGEASFAHIPQDLLGGAAGERQSIQIRHTAAKNRTPGVDNGRDSGGPAQMGARPGAVGDVSRRRRGRR